MAEALVLPFMQVALEPANEANEENSFIKYFVTDPKLDHDGKCHWFKLPHNIRNKIYILAAGGAKPRWVDPITRTKVYMPPLLLTCRRNFATMLNLHMALLFTAKDQRRRAWETASEIAFWVKLDEPEKWDEFGKVSPAYGEWYKAYEPLEAAEQAAKAERVRADRMWSKQIELLVNLGFDVSHYY